jgi:hypothetical protein
MKLGKARLDLAQAINWEQVGRQGSAKLAARANHLKLPCPKTEAVTDSRTYPSGRQ